MPATHEQIHADQRQAGRMMDDGVQQRPILRRPFPQAKPKLVPKGHEAFLKALEASGAEVEFEKAASGNFVKGVIKTSDKYTVSIQTIDGTRVLFKHDISEFFVKAPASFQTPTQAETH